MTTQVETLWERLNPIVSIGFVVIAGLTYPLR